EAADAVDPTGPSRGSVRVLRGGSWLIYPGWCRSAYRGASDPDSRNSYLGFRVIADAAPPAAPPYRHRWPRLRAGSGSWRRPRSRMYAPTANPDVSARALRHRI